MSTEVDIKNRKLDLNIQLLCAWCGPLFVLIYLVFWWGIAGFVPPQDPTWSPEQIFAFYDQNRMSIRIGQMGACVAIIVLVPNWLYIASCIRDIEVRRGIKPMMYLIFNGSAIINMVFLQLISLCWLLCTWTDAGMSAETIKSWHVFGWFLFVVPFALYTLQLITQGFAILLDDSAEPWLPRWCGYLCLAEVPTSALGGLAVFFRTGPFAWNGLLGFYVLCICFAGWIILMGVMMARSVRRRARALEFESSATTDSAPMATVAGS